MEFGDAEGAKRMLREIAEGTELGKAIGNGAVSIGRKRKHHRVPVVKGQAIPAWDPRPLKATGVTYATSPMGADHTAGLIVNPGLPPDQWAQASQEAQLVNAVCDSSGFCQFLQPTLDEHPRVLRLLRRQRGLARADRRHGLAVPAGRVGVQPPGGLHGGGRRAGRLHEGGARSAP